jgi:hypothetical protein
VESKPSVPWQEQKSCRSGDTYAAFSRLALKGSLGFAAAHQPAGAKFHLTVAAGGYPG